MPDPSDGAGNDRRYQLRPRRSFARGRLVRSMLVLALLAGLHRWWGDRAEVRFEREVAALAAAGEPVSLAGMTQPAVRDELNGTLELRLAAAGAAPGPESLPNLTAPPQIPLTAAERQQIGALVAAHGAAFDAVRAARAKGRVDWQIPIRSPEWVDQAYRLEGLGDLMALLGYAALYEHDRGNDALALDHLRSLLFVGRSLTARPFLFSQRSGNFAAAVASLRLAEIAPDLRVAPEWGGGATRGAATPSQLRDVVAEFLDDSPWRDDMRQAFRGERARAVQAARGLAQGRAKLSEVGPGLSPSSYDDPVGRVVVPRFDAYFGRLFRPRVYEDGALVARHLGEVIDRFDASPDWPTAERLIPGLPPCTNSAWTGFTHLTALMLVHPYCWEAKHYYDGATERRLAAAALAVRWYAAEHAGALPARLADLVPDYLPSVPLDPLADAKPLGYVANSERPVVYSVGENGNDDGGREYDPSAPVPGRFETDTVRHLKRRPRRILQWTTVPPNPAPVGG
jgi:hypothetical protein